MIHFLFMVSSLILLATAHLQLQFPPGLNSKYDPQTPQNLIDYSLTSPLSASGSNWPCHGYATPAIMNPLKSVATLVSGQPFTFTLSDGAYHNGGTCQLAVSYDGGVTFAVLASIVGGCPLAVHYTIQIPELPAAKKVLFVWNWYNEVGNREDYQDCALVDVVGTASSFTAPAMFRANTLGNGCQTIEGQDMVFQNPGAQVIYGGNRNANSPATFLRDCLPEVNVTLRGTGSSSPAPEPASASSSATSSTSTATTLSVSISSTSSSLSPSVSSSSIIVPVSTSSAAASASVSTSPDLPAATSISPSSTITVPSFISSSTSISVSIPTSVAPTAIHSNSKPRRPTTGKKSSTKLATKSITALPATPTLSSTSATATTTGSAAALPKSGIYCTSLTTFKMCDANGCDYPNQAVAPGTACRDNTIGFMRMKRGIHYGRGH